MTTIPNTARNIKFESHSSLMTASGSQTNRSIGSTNPCLNEEGAGKDYPNEADDPEQIGDSASENEKGRQESEIIKKGRKYGRDL